MTEAKNTIHKIVDLKANQFSNMLTIETDLFLNFAGTKYKIELEVNKEPLRFDSYNPVIGYVILKAESGFGFVMRQPVYGGVDADSYEKAMYTAACSGEEVDKLFYANHNLANVRNALLKTSVGFEA